MNSGGAKGSDDTWEKAYISVGRSDLMKKLSTQIRRPRRQLCQFSYDYVDR